MHIYVDDVLGDNWHFSSTSVSYTHLKAHEGTRLRFKLLDDVTVSGTKLKKGTYLYGTVTGFGQQRVRASITSILIGDRFIKVKLSVFDLSLIHIFMASSRSLKRVRKSSMMSGPLWIQG